MAYAPTVILVCPQMGENIGAAARAMMNFGLSELRLVRPRDGWPNAKAHETAAKAECIIEQAQIYASLPEALHDCHFALATAQAGRNVDVPQFSARQGAECIHAQNGKTALVFGRESYGLSGEEIACCHALVSISTAPDYTSLNLAQAVGVVAYEWWVATGAAAFQQHDLPDYASMAEIEALHARLLEALAQTDYLRSPDKAALHPQQLRQLLTRPHLLRTEVQAWHGIVKALCVTNTDESSHNRHDKTK
jgi:tRNA/rRNA methyltransferase